MDTEEIIQELEETPEAILDQVLNFLRFVKAQQAQDAIEDQQDLEDARAALAEAETEGTIPLEAFKQELGVQPCPIELSWRSSSYLSVENREVP